MTAYDIFEMESFQCRGLKTIPSSLTDFTSKAVKDDWIMNIKCVIFGTKKVALTDYDSFKEPEMVKEYYSTLGDIDSLDTSSIEFIYDADGTKYWFKPENKKNAELLRDLQFNEEKQVLKLPKGFDRGIIQSLLLGYTDTSIILYKLSNDNDQKDFLTDENYSTFVKKYFKKYGPKIETHRKFLTLLGATLFND